MFGIDTLFCSHIFNLLLVESNDTEPSDSEGLMYMLHPVDVMGKREITVAKSVYIPSTKYLPPPLEALSNSWKRKSRHQFQAICSHHTGKEMAKLRFKLRSTYSRVITFFTPS
jgi:hypothetical protein